MMLRINEAEKLWKFKTCIDMAQKQNFWHCTENMRSGACG